MTRTLIADPWSNLPNVPWLTKVYQQGTTVVYAISFNEPFSLDLARFAQRFWLSRDGNMGPNHRNFGYVMNQMKVGLKGESTTSRRLIDALYPLL